MKYLSFGLCIIGLFIHIIMFIYFMIAPSSSDRNIILVLLLSMIFSSLIQLYNEFH